MRPFSSPFSASATFCACVLLSVVPDARAEVASPDGLRLGVGGYTSVYGVAVDQDEPAGQSLRRYDMRKDTEVHLSGQAKTTLGTVGAHLELDLDRSDTATIEESYFFIEGEAGRALFGEEDGVTHLLQVAAPGVDPQVDGMRPNINAVNMALLSSSGGLTTNRLMSAHDMARASSKLTYITPRFHGVQAGISFTPSAGEGDRSSLAGLERTDDDVGALDHVSEFAVRYQGDVGGFNVRTGAGVSAGALEASSATTDDRLQWNAGLDVGYGDVRLGVAYLHDDNARRADGDTRVLTAGANWTQGAWIHGASLMQRRDGNNSPLQGAGITSGDSELTRTVVGTRYRWGPGLETRASLAHFDFETDMQGDEERSGWQMLLGTTLQF